MPKSNIIPLYQKIQHILTEKKITYHVSLTGIRALVEDYWGIATTSDLIGSAMRKHPEIFERSNTRKGCYRLFIKDEGTQENESEKADEEGAEDE